MTLLRRHRLAKGLTIIQVASRLRVTAATVQGWETGQWKPRPEMYPKIGAVLGIEPIEITRFVSPERLMATAT
jgi:transcriptional regulator with XRE-family HTH domain